MASTWHLTWNVPHSWGLKGLAEAGYWQLLNIPSRRLCIKKKQKNWVPVCFFRFQFSEFKCWQDLNAMGLKLGLWVEPEMVNQDREGHVMKNRHTAHLFAYSDYGLSDPHLTTWQDSQLYKQHPEWARSHKIFALHLLVLNDVSNDALFLHWLVFHFDGFCCALYHRTCCLWHVYWQLSALESSNYIFVCASPGVLCFAKVLHHPARMRSEGRSRSPWQCWSVEVDVISTTLNKTESWSFLPL